MSVTIKVTTLQAGQPRPYAPHTYEARIEVSAPCRNELPRTDAIHHIVQALVHPFQTADQLAAMDSMTAHYSAKLADLSEGPKRPTTENPHGPSTQTWVARVEIPYTD